MPDAPESPIIDLLFTAQILVIGSSNLPLDLQVTYSIRIVTRV